MIGLTRRTFVKRAGIYGAGAWVVGVGGMASSAQAASLSSGRQATLMAAVDALADVTPGGITTTQATAGIDYFAQWYISAPADVQEFASKTLDGLEAGPATGRFSRLSRSDRLGYLRNERRKRSASDQALHVDQILVYVNDLLWPEVHTWSATI